MTNPTRYNLKVDSDGSAGEVFNSETRVWVQMPRTSVKVEALNVPSYRLSVEKARLERCVFVGDANVEARDFKRVGQDKAVGPNRKLTFRCPGPLLDRLARHVVGSNTVALAALAEFGLNVLIANDLTLSVDGSKFINEDSLILRSKRQLRNGQLGMAPEEDGDRPARKVPTSDSAKKAAGKKAIGKKVAAKRK